MNNQRMQLKSRSRKQRARPAAAPAPTYMTDERLDLLATRYQASRICYLLDITFAAYLLAPKGWDRIAKYMEDGGGCRIVDGELLPNEAGYAKTP